VAFSRIANTPDQFPFEHIDALTGSLVLTFTDLVLPGNGGHNFVWQRTYNSKKETFSGYQGWSPGWLAS
jgi:hypothetical protein